MITRRTKSQPTNRQRRNLPDVSLEWMSSAKYPKMHILPEWMEAICRMPRNEGNALLMAAAGYGTHEIEPDPDELTPEAQEYFYREIRPELDRQHRRFKEGKRI